MSAEIRENYVLAALDMDGTLLNTAHETTAYTRNAICKAAAAGKITVLSTGRCLSELRDHLRALPGIQYVICENGACVYDIEREKAIRQISISPEDIEFVLETARRFDVTRQFFMNNQSYIECIDENTLKRHNIYDFVSVFRTGSIYVKDLLECYRQEGGSIEKINIYFATEADRERFCGLLTDRNLLLAHSIGIGLEISPKDATKARGLEILCRYLNLPLSQVMAVGDGGNDVDIMRVAGLSVAMGNAIEEILALADVVTEDCNHDGAAKAIERYVMREA